MTGYYRRLSEQSVNVRYEVVGQTTEGRDFPVVIISSEANLKNLDALKAFARTLADPRGKTPAEKEQALTEGKVFLVITPSMHSNEVAAVQMAMQFAHDLATRDDEPWKSARDQVVVFLAPTLNPDGLEHVVDWYRKTVRTPYEASNPPALYQKYAGHDNNRDWFMMSLKETQLLTRLMYKEWHPQVLWDVHQQGGKSERMFVPPYRDPLSPNIDPCIVAATNLVGTRAVFDMTQAGLTGVATGSTYDMWWNGGNRSTPARHNMVAILTEAASADYASPVFLSQAELKPPTGTLYVPSTDFVSPWPGGWWRVRDIIDYELTFGRSLLSSITREPRLWKETTLHAAERAVAGDAPGPRGWIIPSDNRDPDAVRRLVDSLLQSGIELNVCPTEFHAGERVYPAGSIVIRRDQPYGAHVKDLFELQRYPDTTAPYDVAGWTLPLLMGVQRGELLQPIGDTVKLQPVDSADGAVAAFTGDASRLPKRDGVLAMADSSSWIAVSKALQQRQMIEVVSEGVAYFDLRPSDDPAVRVKGQRIGRMPRIGIYAPWTPSIDEGWLRWVFDRWQMPYVTVRNESLRAGKLSQFVDVLILPDSTVAALDDGRANGSVPDPYAGGLAPEGAAAIEEFVRGGGTLITFRNASKWTAKLLQLPLTDSTAGDDAKGFACPGSVLRGIPAADSPFTVGLPDSVPLLFADGVAWREPAKAEKSVSDVKTQILMKYAPTQLLLSGYIAKSATIEGAAAWVRADYGKGHVHLFGFQPHFRTWPHGTIPLIFRAALFETPK
ncbi:MAG: M14 family metallopeptidase [Tepidisphaeraceae bacterium]